ncbi:CehA/McbA family metallohydrolase [Bacillales bacterium AN1005]|uniref:CehA/McbA family metallohydrolase n=1 Tax=Niallia taxi TaxID=2499688 RepID=UPI0021A8F366|nr:CehA/McbA family metallohydrolase [Niallia taxi]MCT2344759.1 CehA/McbA family metallohydrolase [Niallia taxi]
MREKEDHILFEINSTLTNKSTQSHIQHSFFVPEDTDEIYVDFSFDPPHQTDIKENNRLSEEAATYYEAKLSQNELIRNLLTISIDDADGFRGARHYHSPIQHHMLSEFNSTAGFLNKRNPAGLWSVTVSIHALVTESCTYKLRIYKRHHLGSETVIPWQDRPLNKQIIDNDSSIPAYPPLEGPVRWVPSELHTHTFHSDGKQSLLEMVEAAKEMGLKAVVMTDHNTISPFEGIEQAEDQTGLHILYGLEWTTFYGHLLTIGYDSPAYTDWRVIGPLDIEKGIKSIRHHGALVGIAHPFRIGNPIGTGCHWEFPVESINVVDFIEVWNSTRPGSKAYNQRAFLYWTDLLNKGYRITATAGRDWHHNEEINPLPAITYVQMSQGSAAKDTFRTAFLQSIRGGRISISYGKPLELIVKHEDMTYSVGDVLDRVENQPLIVQVSSEGWEYNSRIDSNNAVLVIVTNTGEILHGSPGLLQLQAEIKETDVKWIRSELYASIDNGTPELVAFTNPIYIR